MFCYHCGKEINDDELFCPFCGTRISKPIEEEETAEPEPVKPAPPTGNKSNKTVIVAICAAAAVLIAVAAFFFLGRSGADDTATQTIEATEATEMTEEPENVDLLDATEFNGNYYEVMNYGTDWLDAKAACEDRGGHLAIITSQEEEDFIESLIEANRSEDIYHYWLGATDEDVEGTWTWVDGTVFWIGGPAAQGGHSVDGMYNNWLPSQPNNSLKEDSNGQDYLEIQVTMGNEGPAEYMTWTDITEDGVAYGYEGPDDYNDTDYYGHIIEWEGDGL